MSDEKNTTFGALLAGLGKEGDEKVEEDVEESGKQSPKKMLSRFVLQSPEEAEPEDPHRVPTVPIRQLEAEPTEVFEDDADEFQKLLERSRS